ncbi:4Fe-4S binding protein [Rubrivivax gelatinosus]|uniref:Polyferredoxin n=1 Tax=Rubrivivax gelatinosus TaxID=28068 RepID=A0A4R2MJY1_RUBGE|nr:4Fe-4S binding protein [Rubrivivax gelatinosus]MBK1686679.1 4Fe-4S binding protein [Rubrivivax gelatinosus]TCP05297.1 polyferredoxin [Rubrivivax gelatinosus]
MSAALQHRRRLFQAAFLALFVSAPALDLLRFDLHEAQLWLLGRPWTLGITDFTAGRIGATEVALAIVLRAFVPAIVLVVGFLYIAWRWGRLYCGWLCPHFSVVETLDRLMRRALGRASLWDAAPTARGDWRWWPPFVLLAAGLGFLWAVTLLSYLLPPAEVWGRLLAGESTPNQARFLAVATAVFTAEFVFARHLFCRFGCAVGLFQSLAWMANPRAMVVGYDRARARDCRSCSTAAAPGGSACDSVCPMRLKPRDIKRRMFSCVQCGQCLDQCEQSQGGQARQPLLEWRTGADALRETLRRRSGERQARGEGRGLSTTLTLPLSRERERELEPDPALALSRVRQSELEPGPARPPLPHAGEGWGEGRSHTAAFAQAREHRAEEF